jgi:hypothetical protein
MSIDKSTPHTSLKRHEKNASNNTLDEQRMIFQTKTMKNHKQITTNYNFMSIL